MKSTSTIIFLLYTCSMVGTIATHMAYSQIPQGLINGTDMRLDLGDKIFTNILMTSALASLLIYCASIYWRDNYKKIKMLFLLFLVLNIFLNFIAAFIFMGKSLLNAPIGLGIIYPLISSVTLSLLLSVEPSSSFATLCFLFYMQSRNAKKNGSKRKPTKDLNPW